MRFGRYLFGEMMKVRLLLCLLLTAISVNAELLSMISNDADREVYLDRNSIRTIKNDQVVFTLKSVFKQGRRPVGATEVVGIAQTAYTVDCSKRLIQEDRTQYVSDEDKPVGQAPYVVRGWSTIRPGSDFDEIRKKVC
ncbi:hypothetical protein WJ69_20205 [Burkholderia ubonensis]|nr:hypothetical protein WJ69_20205 [Burkholderia ubonensis]